MIVLSAIAFASASAFAEQFTYACRFVAVNGQDVKYTDRKYVVDLADKTVDGFPADITETEIRWQSTNESPSTLTTIDRRTGRVSATNSIGLSLSGDCAKPRKRPKPQLGSGSSNAHW